LLLAKVLMLIVNMADMFSHIDQLTSPRENRL